MPYDEFEDFKGLTDCPSCLALCQRIPPGTTMVAAIFQLQQFLQPRIKITLAARSVGNMRFTSKRALSANHKAPPFFRIVERAKFNAWHSLKGMSKEDAQEKLTQHVSAACPSWKELLDGKMLRNVRPKNPRGKRKIRRIFLGRTVTPDEIFWVPDAHAGACFKCNNKFTVTRRIHHCRSCGRCCCSACSEKKTCADCLVAS